MKKSIKFIKKNLNPILILVGTFLVGYNLLNFSYNGCFRTYLLCEKHYYYNDDVLLSLAIGSTLIVLGVLILKNKINRN